jgi:hypothetical protein
MLNKFAEVNDSLNRKLASEEHTYLIENRLSEVDILLYSYLKLLHTNKPYFDSLLDSLKQFKHLETFFANMDEKYSNLLKEKLNIS